jgi:[ribosomal protein S5]-alanine N-acetyltransferase
VSTPSTRVTLRQLTAGDRAEFTGRVTASSGLLRPWAVLPGTSEEFDAYLERFDGETAQCLLVCLRETGAIAGTISLSDISRGPYQRATVGYNAFLPHARQGHLSAGMGLAIRYAFDDLKLHRLEADIQPANRASLEFARKTGFRREGYSPGLVYIDGAWRDHERWAMTAG